jgi:hypothetical protein
MSVDVRINHKPPGRDQLLASVGGRRFPAPVTVTNTGAEAAHVELRVREGAGSRLVIDGGPWTVPAGDAVETRLWAETPSPADLDTVIEVIVDGRLDAEFRFTAVSLARESVFHNFLGRDR